MITMGLLQMPYSLAVPGSSGRLWGMSRKPFTLLFALALSACVTAEELDQRLQVWVGRDSDSLAAEWGAPNGTYQMKDGGHVLSYERMAVITTGVGEGVQAASRTCRVDFTTDKDGKILQARWSGAADQCDRSIP